MLYSDAAALQVGLYLWNRRHNVSPHEPDGSGGLAGMAMSALSAPIYLKSLGAAVLRRPSRFVVTPKGGDASPDRVLTFRHPPLLGGRPDGLARGVVRPRPHARGHAHLGRPGPGHLARPGRRVGRHPVPGSAGTPAARRHPRRARVADAAGTRAGLSAGATVPGGSLPSGTVSSGTTGGN